MAGTLILKDPKSKKDQLVYLRYHIGNGRYFKYSTGEKINPDDWNQSENRAIRAKGKKGAELKVIDTQLQRYPTLLEIIISDSKLNGFTLSKEYLKKMFDSKFKENLEGADVDFFSVLEEFLTEKRQERSLTDDTIARYKNIGKILKEFEKSTKYKITFESLNDIFYSKFVAFSREIKRHQNNTLGRNIGFLKTILNWATRRGFNHYSAYNDFKKTKAPTDAIALTDEEVMLLYNYDFGKRKALSKARDLFVFGCFTGMRYSDYSRINKKTIRDNHIRTTQIKGKSLLNIPLNKYSSQILLKWNYSIPTISNQKLNDYIKEACFIVGIKDEIEKVSFIGKERIEETFKKCDLVGTHTARRTFITTALNRGMQVEVVMKITGHTDYKSFVRYYKIGKIHVQNQMENLFGESEIKLKVS